MPDIEEPDGIATLYAVCVGLAHKATEDNFDRVVTYTDRLPTEFGVVLVTDDEETCDGDAEKVIQRLRDKGFDVTLNIVGFAIDDAELESQFEGWAKLAVGDCFENDFLFARYIDLIEDLGR